MQKFLIPLTVSLKGHTVKMFEIHLEAEDEESARQQAELYCQEDGATLLAALEAGKPMKIRTP